MSPGRVYAIVLRYLYGIPSDVPRLFDIFFWPLVDLFVWGFLTVYLAQARGGVDGGIDSPGVDGDGDGVVATAAGTEDDEGSE